MDSGLKKGLFLVTLMGAAMIPGLSAKAADSDDMTSGGMPGIGIEAVLNDCYSQDKDIQVEEYLVPTKKGVFRYGVCQRHELSLYKKRTDHRE